MQGLEHHVQARRSAPPWKTPAPSMKSTVIAVPCIDDHARLLVKWEKVP